VGPSSGGRHPDLGDVAVLGLPTGAVETGLRGRRVYITREEDLAPDAPLFPQRPESVYRLRRSARAYVVLAGDEETAAHAGHRLFVLPAHRRRGVGFALAVALLRERPLDLGWRFTPAALRLHQRAYRIIVLEALAAGGYVHPQALALLRVLQDGQCVDFPKHEERFDIISIEMLPRFRSQVP
jgi:GNAT superfamily N-acetyltransferase